MKKILSILASTGLIATAAASVVACGAKQPKPSKKQKAKVPVDPILVNLKETINGETLQGKDISLVHDAIITGMKSANIDAVFDNQTFEVDVTNLTPESNSVQVKVQETESTSDKHGLDGQPVFVNLALNALLIIDAELENEEIFLEQSTTLTIKNYNDSIKYQIDGDSTMVDIGEIDKEGKTTITGKKQGDTTLIITADNFQTKELTLKINSKEEIITTLEKSELSINEKIKLTILNYVSSKNFKINTDSSKSIEIEDHHDGTAYIIGLKENLTAPIIITADNFQTKELTLKINSKKLEIKYDWDRESASYLFLGVRTKLTILNYEELLNFRVEKTIRGGNVTIEQDETDKNVYWITGIEKGLIDLKLNSDSIAGNIFFDRVIERQKL